jgi:hypothetical protein
MAVHEDSVPEESPSGPGGAETLPVTASQSTPLVVKGSEALLDGADAHLHRLGLAYLETTELSKAVSLERALIVFKARSIYGGRGRDSQFGDWLDRYAPDLGPKQAQRLANIVEYFAGGADKLDSVSNLSALETLLHNFKMSALYRLATSAVPPAARTEALTQAAAGVIVTPALALELIEKHTIPAELSSTQPPVVRRRKKDRETIVVDGGGKVTVRSSDGDFLRTLKLAVKLLERMTAST